MKDIVFQGSSRLWWVPLVTGVLSVLLGVWIILCPLPSLLTLAYVFAVCMLFTGILNLSYSIFTTGVASNWGWALALGIFEIIGSIWMFSLPPIVMTDAFVFIVGIWILVVAINSLCEACVMKSYSVGTVIWMVCLLIATIFLAIVFLSSPISGGIAVWLWLALSFVTFGIFRIILSARLRKLFRATRS